MNILTDRAFPSTAFTGLTKREYFVAAAMQGILSSAVDPERGALEITDNELKSIAKTSRIIADHCLEAAQE